jgi:hypothetical protein
MPRNASKEADIILAIKSIKKGIFESARAAGKALGIDHSTISCRMKGRPSRADSMAKQRKLSKLEGDVLIERILDMDARGFSYGAQDVADMANILIDKDTRVDRDHVGKNWAS